ARPSDRLGSRACQCRTRRPDRPAARSFPRRRNRRHHRAVQSGGQRTGRPARRDGGHIALRAGLRCLRRVDRLVRPAAGPAGHRRQRLRLPAGRARGQPVNRSTAPALAGPVPAGPGAAGSRLLDDGSPAAGRCRLLGIFAHPDDETFCAGGTFARYAEQGAEIMVVSATRGQAGQIRDATAGSRRTIAAVREAELRLACERLGITKVHCLDHIDGTLADAGFPALVDEVAEVICGFGPDIVITFGPDGGYGHPDHVTISTVTTAACRRVGAGSHSDGSAAWSRGRPPRLYYSHFPPADLLIL